MGILGDVDKPYIFVIVFIDEINCFLYNGIVNLHITLHLVSNQGNFVFDQSGQFVNGRRFKDFAVHLRIDKPPVIFERDEFDAKRIDSGRNIFYIFNGQPGSLDVFDKISEETKRRCFVAGANRRDNIVNKRFGYASFTGGYNLLDLALAKNAVVDLTPYMETPPGRVISATRRLISTAGMAKSSPYPLKPT